MPGVIDPETFFRTSLTKQNVCAIIITSQFHLLRINHKER